MTDFLDDIMAEVSEISASSDKMEILKASAKLLRSLEHKKEELETELAEIKKKIHNLMERDLVNLFGELNLTSLTLEAEGNYPAMKFDKTTYYNAKIPEDKEAEAFAWLHDHGHGDIVKTVVSASFGMGERESAEQVEAAISQLGVDFNSKLSVHPSTLKAFAKSEIEAGNALPMETLGIYVGETVKMKIVKGK
jgi:hypothetical protein